MKTHSIPNKSLAKKIREWGFSVSYSPATPSQRQSIFMDGSLSCVGRMINAMGEPNGSPEIIDLACAGNIKANINRAIESTHKSRDDEKWVGGSPEKLKNDLSGNVDMKPFYKARNEFAKTGIERKIATAIRDVVPRRKRIMSEHDGEWIFDRRWDITPFASTTKQIGAGRTLDILCHFAVAAYTDAESLNRYGAMAWALSDLIESAGVQTNLTLRFSVDEVVYRTGDAFIDINVKKAGQYVAPPLIAATHQSIFFRRPIFSMICLSADLMKREVDSSLGRPRQHTTHIAFEEGKLVLAPKVMGATSQEIEEKIIQAIQSKLGKVAVA